MLVLIERGMGDLNVEQRAMYPLFQKGHKAQSGPTKADPIHDSEQNHNDVKPSRPVPKKRPSRARKGLESGLPAQPLHKPLDSAADPENEGLLEVDPNTSRRKRRKTTPPDDKPISSSTVGSMPSNLVPPRPRGRPRKSNKTPLQDQRLEPTITRELDVGDVQVGEHSEQGEIPSEATANPTSKQLVIELDDTASSSPMPVCPPEIENKDQTEAATTTHTSAPLETVDSKPTRILRFNPKTGTIGSPPAKNSPPTVASGAKTSRKTRGSQPKSVMVTIHYGVGERLPSSIGPKIDEILSGKEKRKPVSPAVLPKPQETIKQPPKPIHPLFLGKAAKTTHKTTKSPNSKENTIVDLTQVKTMPPKPRPRSRERNQSLFGRPLVFNLGQPSGNEPAFHGFGKDSKLLKFPGAVEPAWPWKGMVHIRGEISTSGIVTHLGHSSNIPSRTRKSKDSAAEVHGNEDVLSALAIDLAIGHVRKSIRHAIVDDFRLPPVCLRAPLKYNESGINLQKRVRKELIQKMPPPGAAMSSSEDEISNKPTDCVRIHSALSKMYSAIPTSLSAFDQGQCESQAWIHKYSPNYAAEILQTRREAMILKEWLQTLTVQSVEAGLGEKSKSRGSLGAKQAKAEGTGKRKRKPKLDGFVVSSGDEDDDMDEISEPEDETPLPGSRRSLRKTVVRVGDLKGSKDSTKMANTVVLSGPHGVGKTAAVYAVAKELGFEVFEINSSNRRSGKDILEKVGDMTRNHLVQGSNRTHLAEVVDEDKQRIDDALAEDLESGRQGTMNSFFKVKPATEPKSKLKKPVQAENKSAEKEVIASKPRATEQKQSLILIEEADIIFKEDTQFWVTIMSLMLTSKRPIVMTCNDESALPIQSLSLHAIIRFNPPPPDLAADYLLLVAACEGHVLRHEAAKALYESRGSDLRASLTELNFWCQFAVADTKGGLDWYPERWPRGCDIDKDGNTLRVVSEGTYETGMGWLCQDFIESHLHHLDIEEEMLHEACDGWNLDAGDWHTHLDVDGWAGRIQKLSSGKDDDRAALEMYSDFVEYMSVIDLCSDGTFASENKVTIDTSQPKVSAKVREDYTLASELLEAFPLVNHSTLGKDISLFMKSRARKYLQVDSHVAHNLEVPIELDRPSESQILDLIRKQSTTPSDHLTRHDFSLAFDPISEAPKPTYVWTNTSTLEASSFDRTITPIVEDLAPYVRSIVAYDKRLADERKKLSGLMSEGGKAKKRMRTTRAAMSALEGGERRNTRKEKWFSGGLNTIFVERTGMEVWTDAAVAMERVEREELAAGSSEKSHEKDESS